VLQYATHTSDERNKTAAYRTCQGRGCYQYYRSESRSPPVDCPDSTGRVDIAGRGAASSRARYGCNEAGSVIAAPSHKDGCQPARTGIRPDVRVSIENESNHGKTRGISFVPKRHRRSDRQVMRFRQSAFGWLC